MSRLFSRISNSLFRGTVTKQQPIRLNTAGPTPGPPPPSASSGPTPGKGKGPITWRSFAFISVGGAGCLGFMWYVKDEKEQGNLRNIKQFEVGNVQLLSF